MNTILTHNHTNINNHYLFNLDIFKSHDNSLWESNFFNSASNYIISVFIAHLESLDNEFFNSNNRLTFYLSKDRPERTLVTIFGTVTFKRRRYQNRTTGKYFYYIDSLLGITKKQRITNQVQAQILHSISFEHESYRKACQPFGLSKSTAYYLIKKLDPEHYVPDLSKIITCDNLHIVADEDHIALQNKKIARKSGTINSYMLRHATIFTGIKKVSKKRNQLQNRVTLTQLEREDITEFTDRVNEFIMRNYKVKDTVYVYGDGAGWIQTLANNTCATFILDKFHMKQALFRICGGKTNKPIRDILENYLEGDKRELFNETVKSLNKDNFSDFKKKNLKYINNFWNSYQNNFKIPQALYCCAEGINSHYFSEYFSSRPKGFSKSNIHKIGYLISLAHSKHLLQTYFIDNFASLLKNTDEPLHKKPSTSNQVYKSNLPIVSAGRTAKYVKLINSIAHNPKTREV